MRLGTRTVVRRICCRDWRRITVRDVRSVVDAGSVSVGGSDGFLGWVDDGARSGGLELWRWREKQRQGQRPGWRLWWPTLPKPGRMGQPLGWLGWEGKN